MVKSRKAAARPARVRGPASAPAPELERMERALAELARELRSGRRAGDASRPFRELVEGAPDVLLLLDRDGTIEYASPSLAVVLGLRPEQAAGRKLGEFLPPGEASLLLAAISEALSSPGAAPSRDVRGPRGDGAWRVLELRLARLPEPEARVVAVARDVTEEREKSARTAAGEERHLLALAAAGDVVWDFDLESGRAHFGSGFGALVGRPGAPADERPEAWLDLVHPEDLPRLRRDIDDHVEGQTPKIVNEHRLRLADGRLRWLLARGQAVPGPDGRARRLVGTLLDIAERKAAEELLVHQALHDPLTGLPHRAGFLERLQRGVARARHRPEYLFAVLFLDVDHFKLINEGLGHLAGDQLLVAMARRLAGSLRPGDMVAYLGGAAFGILVDHLKAALDATVVAERILKDLQAPFALAGQEVPVRASIGISLSGGGYQRAEDALRDADVAMFRAKSKGGGSYEIFDPATHALVAGRLKLRAEVRRAFERHELRIHYQPIVSMADGRIHGFEALLRWQHRERGLLSASEFVHAAQETGLVVPIGAWVLREACAQARRCQQAVGDERLAVSVNLTSLDLAQPAFPGSVERVLSDTGLSASSLVFEITESHVIQDLEAVLAVLLALKRLGVELHLDDFGTGYSSLSYLHQLPADALKIDRSFVGRLGGGGTEDVIVRAILGMARDLDRRVIAEGVESEEQFRLLKELGCDFGQGHFFSPPVDEAGLSGLLGSWRGF